MTTLFGSRQRAADFAARVDGTGGAAPGSRRTSDADSSELDELVGLVSGLREHAETHAPAFPRPAFSIDLRERLLAEAATTSRAARDRTATAPVQRTSPRDPVRPHRMRDRVLVAGASAAILLGGTAGVADAAHTALPGQALYPVKRSIEGVDARLSGSPSAHGRALLEHASVRLDEVRLLDAGGPVEHELIPGTLDEFTRQAHQGALLLMQGYRETDDPDSIAEVRAFAADQLPVLETLSGSTADDAQSQLRDAAVALRSIDSEASDACSACSDLAPLDPTLALTSLDVARTDGSSSVPGETASGEPEEATPAAGGETGGTLPTPDPSGSPTDGSSPTLVPGTPVDVSASTPAGPGQPAASGSGEPGADTGASAPVTDSSGIPVAPGAVPSVPDASSVTAPPRVPTATVPAPGVVAPTAGAPSTGSTTQSSAPAPAPAPAPPPVVPQPSAPAAPDPAPAPEPDPAPTAVPDPSFATPTSGSAPTPAPETPTSTDGVGSGDSADSGERTVASTVGDTDETISNDAVTKTEKKAARKAARAAAKAAQAAGQ